MYGSGWGPRALAPRVPSTPEGSTPPLLTCSQNPNFTSVILILNFEHRHVPDPLRHADDEGRPSPIGTAVDLRRHLAQRLPRSLPRGTGGDGRRLPRALYLSLARALSRPLSRSLSLALSYSLSRQSRHAPCRKRAALILFFTLVTCPGRSLSLKLSDTRVHEPQYEPASEPLHISVKWLR